MDSAASPDQLGVRIISAMASDISYYRIYGINTTILRMKCRPRDGQEPGPDGGTEDARREDDTRYGKADQAQ